MALRWDCLVSCSGYSPPCSPPFWLSVPAGVLVTRGNLNPAMGQSGAVGATPPVRRLRSALATAQLSIAVVLLTASVLLLESMYRLTRIDTGFERTGLVTAHLLLYSDRYPSRTTRRALVRQLVERVEAVPGVQAVSVGPPPLVGGNGPSFTEGWSSIFFFRDSTRAGAPGHDLWVKYVDEKYLATFGIRVLAGRGFGPGDDESAPAVALVNEAASRLIFPTSPALGASLAQLPQSVSNGRSITVVGILSDVRQRDITIAAFPEIWLPLRQQNDSYGDVYVTARTVRNVDVLAATIRKALGALDVPFSGDAVSTMDDIVRRTLAPQRFILTVMRGFALTAVVLAALGLYALLAYITATRTRELGVRMALGARPEELRSQVMRSGLAHATTGAGVGIFVAYPLTQFMTPFLYHVDSHDPLAFFAAAAVLIAAALLGTYAPARRATTVDPLIALRSE